MSQLKGLGNLQRNDPDWWQRANRKNVYESSPEYITKFESIEEKRKRLFNKQSGSLQLNLSGLPKWIWNEEKHHLLHKYTKGYCCFSHIVGLPTNAKTGIPQPFFPFQKELDDALFKNEYANPNNDPKRWKHVMVKKATGAGFTEGFIYDVLYLPLAFPHVFYDSQIAIITGINMTTTKRIMRRMRNVLGQKLGIFFDSNDRVLDINGCIIEAFPAIKPDTYRSLDNMKGAVYDEMDFCPPSLIEDVRDAIERYFPKSDPFTILGSTANEPDGMMERLEKMPEEKMMYKKLFWLVDKLRGTMLTDYEILLAQQSDSYPREYLGEYRGLKGNLFSQDLLDYAAGRTDELKVMNKDPKNPQVLRTIHRPKDEVSIHEVVSNWYYLGRDFESSFGTDPAWMSSIFATVVNKFIDGIVYAVREFEMEQPMVEAAVIESKRLMYDEYPWENPKNYVDSYGTPYIRALKAELKENTEYHKMSIDDRIYSMLSPKGMIVCPIPFGTYGDRMNYWLRRLFELGMYRVHPDITPHLWTSLKTARYDEDHNRFNKKATSKNDVYDAARLAAINWNLGDMGVLITEEKYANAGRR